MKYLFAPGNVAVLRKFAQSQVVVGLDFDGTLAPISLDLRKAAMRPATRRALERTAARYPTVVVSGRAQQDVGNRVHGLGLRAVAGNHGMEPWDHARRFETAVAKWLPSLRRALRTRPGVEIENKRYSVTIHYRRSQRKADDRREILRTVNRLGPVRVIRGKQAISILPDGAPHKGLALDRLRSRLGCDTAIFLGDDRTDEDVFSLRNGSELLAIRVGRSRHSAARYYIRSQSETTRLLNLLASCRNGRGDHRVP